MSRLNADGVFGSGGLSVNVPAETPEDRPIPGITANENPGPGFSIRSGLEVDTTRLAKVFISHVDLERLLDLPEDVKITSMHTTRGLESTGIYMICDRFESISPGAVAPELSLENVGSMGLWDEEAN